MKRFFKVLAGAITAILLSLCCFSLVGCKDIKTIDVHISVYDIEKGYFADETPEGDVVITVKLYRHLAPKTVDAILSYAEKGYYNDAAFYKFEDENTMQIMVGDYAFRNGAIHQNKADYLAPVTGEFAKNNTTGSNLTNVAGALGLWRSWGTEGYKISDNSRDSGVATWYLPTQPINDYNDYFCVFGIFDLTADEDKWDNYDTWELIRNIFNNEDYYTSYTVFYTGEYDATKGQAENFGLTYHCVKTADFNPDDYDDIFEAKGQQYTCYNKKKVNFPVATVKGNETVTAKINNIVIK